MADKEIIEQWGERVNDPKWATLEFNDRMAIRESFWELIAEPLIIEEGYDPKKSYENFNAYSTPFLVKDLDKVPIPEEDGSPTPLEPFLKLSDTTKKIFEILKQETDGYSGEIGLETVKRGAETAGQILDVLLTPTLANLEEKRELEPVGAGDVVNNLMVGGTEMIVSTPMFFTQLASNPAETLSELKKFGIDATENSVGALMYLGMELFGIGDEGLTADVKGQLKERWETVKVRPEEPVMLLLAAAGLVRGIGKFKGTPKGELMGAMKRGEVKSADIQLIERKMLEIDGGVSLKDVPKRMAEIDANVQQFQLQDLPLPEAYSEATITRSAKRLGLDEVATDALLEKAKNSRGLSTEAVKVANESRRQHRQIEDIAADTQKKMDANYAQQKDALQKDATSRAKQFTRNFVDRAGNVKSLLAKSGALGEEAARQRELAAGGGAEAVRQIDMYQGELGKVLKARDIDDFGWYKTFLRIREIDNIRAWDRYHAGGKVSESQMGTAEVVGEIRRLKKLVREADVVEAVDANKVSALKRQLRDQEKALAKSKADAAFKRNEAIETAKAHEAGSITTAPIRPARHKVSDTAGASREADLRVSETLGAIDRLNKEIAELSKPKQNQSNVAVNEVRKGKIATLENALSRRRAREKDAIEKFKDLPEIKHAQGLTKEHADWFLTDIEMNWGAEKLQRVKNANDIYQRAMRDQLDQLLSEGLIDQGMYDRLAIAQDYYPREFIQHSREANIASLDPELSFRVKGKTQSTTKSGIERLDAGSEEALVTNPKYLLAQTVLRTQRIIAKNKADKALLKVAEENAKLPDGGSGLVQLINENDPTPKGFNRVSAFRDGKRHDMIMPEEIGAEWIGLPPEIGEGLSTFARHFSGSSILKPMATGINPEFAITNLPRDIGLVYLSTAGKAVGGSQVYSSFAPKFGMQMAADLAKVFPDVALRSKSPAVKQWLQSKGLKADFLNDRVTSYIKEGGGMEFLTGQGHLLKREISASRSRWTGSIKQSVQTMQDILGYMGQTSELMTRLAVRERAIKAGLSPERATHVARSYLDFSLGGSITKAIDVGVPYLNASVQGTRSIVRAAKDDLKLFVWKASQIGMLSTGLYLANTAVNPEAYKAIPDRDKINNFIITTGIEKKDGQGNIRHGYLKIPKDQGQRPIAYLGEALMARLLTGEMPIKQALTSLQESIPIGPQSIITPIVGALGAANNIDLWTWDKVWDDSYNKLIDASLEFDDRTPQAFVDLGEATGLSPKRTQRVFQKFVTYGNVYTDLVGLGYKKFVDHLADEERELVGEMVLSDVPFARRVVKFTNPYIEGRDDLERVSREENSKALIRRREILDLAEKGDKDGLTKYINSLPPNERESARRVRKNAEDIARLDIPNKPLWLRVKSQPVATRAKFFFDKYYKADDAGRKELLMIARKLGFRDSKQFNLQFNSYKQEAGIE